MATEFGQAAAYLKQIGPNLNTSELLYFYARFKQVTVGDCNVKKPGFFDFQGKQKWEAWSALKNTPKDTAAQQYVDKLDSIEPDWRSKSTDENTASQQKWVVVSSMASTDTNLDDCDKTIFDWCKEGNVDKLRSYAGDVNIKDDDGMSLLHWACDRGYHKAVETLLSKSAEIDIQDADSQTPLHYAASCGHVEVVLTLLKAGADVTRKDSDGCLAADMADPNVKKDVCWTCRDSRTECKTGSCG